MAENLLQDGTSPPLQQETKKVRLEAGTPRTVSFHFIGDSDVSSETDARLCHHKAASRDADIASAMRADLGPFDTDLFSDIIAGALGPKKPDLPITLDNPTSGGDNLPYRRIAAVRFTCRHPFRRRGVERAQTHAV